MPDSTTLIQELLRHSSSLDSIDRKLSLLQNATIQHDDSPTFSIWIPLLSAIIGGLLVWIGQAIERWTRLSTERKKSLLNIYAFCRKLEAEMKNHYRELAMAKLHVEYWWHGANQPGSDNKKCYEEHLRSQALAREVEKNIGQTKADYIGHVRKFQALTPLDIEIEQKLELISELTNPKAKSYDASIPHQKIRYEMAENDEKELRELYYKNLEAFKIINDKLQILVSRRN